MLKVKPIPRIIFLAAICVVFAVCFAIFVIQPNPIQSGEKQLTEKPATVRTRHLRDLTGMLDDTDPSVRFTAIKLLGDIREKTVPGLIKKYLNDKSKSVIMETAKSLARYGDMSGVPELIKILNERPKEGNLKPYERIKWATAYLARAKAAEYLGDIGDKRAIEALTNASKEEDGRIRDAALIALVKLGEKSRIDVFVDGLNSGFESAMEKACDVLGDLKETSVRQRLRELLKTWNKNIKRAAVIALGKIGDSESADTIRKMLTDKDAIVRAAASEALGAMRDVNSLEALKSALRDDNGFVRLKAAEALMKLSDDSGERFVVSSVSVGDIDARLEAVKILAAYGKKGDIPAMESAFENESNKAVKAEMSAAVIRIIDREE